MIATLPSAAPVLKASCASRMRQFEGNRPACAMARSARAAAKNDWKRTDAPERNFGRGCNRIQERGEASRGAERKLGTRLQSHPGRRDPAELSFRADEQAVGTRPGTRSRQA